MQKRTKQVSMAQRPPVCSRSFLTEADEQSNETDCVISGISYTLGSVDPQPRHPRVPNELAQIQQKEVSIRLPLRHSNN